MDDNCVGDYLITYGDKKYICEFCTGSYKFSIFIGNVLFLKFVSSSSMFNVLERRKAQMRRNLDRNKIVRA